MGSTRSRRAGRVTAVWWVPLPLDWGLPLRRSSGTDTDEPRFPPVAQGFQVRKDGSILYREWAPGAKAAFLFGEFSASIPACLQL